MMVEADTGKRNARHLKKNLQGAIVSSGKGQFIRFSSITNGKQIFRNVVLYGNIWTIAKPLNAI